MNTELIKTLTNVIDSSTTLEELEDNIKLIPGEEYKKELQSVIDSRREALEAEASDNAEINLDGLTTSEIVQLIADKPELKDAIQAALFATPATPAEDTSTKDPEEITTTDRNEEDKELNTKEGIEAKDLEEGKEGVEGELGPAEDTEIPGESEITTEDTDVTKEETPVVFSYTTKDSESGEEVVAEIPLVSNTFVVDEQDITDHLVTFVQAQEDLKKTTTEQFETIKSVAKSLNVTDELLENENLTVDKLVVAINEEIDSLKAEAKKAKAINDFANNKETLGSKVSTDYRGVLYDLYNVSA